MEINIWAVIVATIVQFIIGMVWYTPIFGKVWGEIHGFDKLSKEKQKEMEKEMGPWYGVQLAMTVITTIVFAKTLTMLPDNSPYALAAMLWLGFMLPAQVSSILFGGTEPKNIVKKSLIMVGGSLACLLGAAVVFSLFA
jgi:hypothetical protein